MRKLLAVLLIVAFCPAAALAGTTPVLTAEGQSLRWSGSASTYIVERTPGPTFLTVVGHTLTPQAEPARSASFRVRPKASPKRWSNTVTLSWAAEEAPKEPPKEEGKETPPSNSLGRVRVAPDTAEWGAYENATWAPWAKEHLAYLRLYPGSGQAWLSLGIPDESYRDWDASWEGVFAPLSPSRREAFVSQKSAADKAAGYGGNFIDDVNFTLGFRDNLQSSALEPEQAELGRFVAAVRASWGAGALLDCNTQMFDALSEIHSGSPSFLEDLNACNVQTKEFGVSATSGITSASAWASFLEWVDVVHAHHAQVRMTGSIPVSLASFELNEATYYLISQAVTSFGGDLLWLSKQLPSTTCSSTPVEHGWWCGLNLSLGEATSMRERASSGVWTRRFSGGVVYVNEPGNSTQTFAVPAGMHNVKGEAVSSLTLAGDAGAVLSG